LKGREGGRTITQKRIECLPSLLGVRGKGVEACSGVVTPGGLLKRGSRVFASKAILLSRVTRGEASRARVKKRKTASSTWLNVIFVVAWIGQSGGKKTLPSSRTCRGKKGRIAAAYLSSRKKGRRNR